MSKFFTPGSIFAAYIVIGFLTFGYLSNNSCYEWAKKSNERFKENSFYHDTVSRETFFCSMVSGMFWPAVLSGKTAIFITNPANYNIKIQIGQ